MNADRARQSRLTLDAIDSLELWSKGDLSTEDVLDAAATPAAAVEGLMLLNQLLMATMLVTANTTPERVLQAARDTCRTVRDGSNRASNGHREAS